MELHELRVGNLIEWDMNDSQDENDDFDYGFSSCTVELWHLEHLERIRPVLLTEEILLLWFGFRYLPPAEYDLDTLEYDGIRVWNKNNRTELYVEGVSFDLKYVHQLQNFYFGQKGKELNLVL